MQADKFSFCDKKSELNYYVKVLGESLWDQLLSLDRLIN